MENNMKSISKSLNKNSLYNFKYRLGVYKGALINSTYGINPNIKPLKDIVKYGISNARKNAFDKPSMESKSVPILDNKISDISSSLLNETIHDYIINDPDYNHMAYTIHSPGLMNIKDYSTISDLARTLREQQSMLYSHPEFSFTKGVNYV